MVSSKKMDMDIDYVGELHIYYREMLFTTR